MKKRFLGLLFLCIATITALYADETIVSVFEKSYEETDLLLCLRKGLEKLNVDLKSEIPAEKLSVIHFILKNTFENNIHKMRGEEGNRVYTKETGEEAVFDKDGKLVTNDWNKGSFNFGSYEKPIKKFELDIWPWLVWGNTRADPTTFDERFYYYIMDLDFGIQEYIFLEDKAKLEKIDYADLDETAKLVYCFFDYLLFNKNYEFDLSAGSIEKYKEDATGYWKYLAQLLKLAGYK